MTDRQRRADRAFGIVGGLLVLLGIVFLARWMVVGGSDTGAAAVPPTLRILSPAPGDTVSQPLVVELDAGATLAMGASGWAAGTHHLHLRIDATELMAGGGDLAPVSGTRYRWTVGRLPAGPVVLRLSWSDAQHRPLMAGASAEVPVVLR